MIKRKSVTQRAAEAVKNNASSAELAAIKAEISQRIQQVDTELKAKEAEIENVMGDGDLDALRAVRQSEADLRDEDKLLHRQQSELHRAIGIAQGEEAMKAAGQHRKNLAKALEQAEKARALLQEAQQAARLVITARNQAAHIGSALVFEADTIRALAAALYPEGNERKQLMIDLGIRDAMKAA
ncbi:MAG: hypothetical protein CME40_03105 [Haliea sp.]|nr:hypothetical protein [Haliea sp.]|tara:strand:+ start:169791 stop:170342 length:552 start_codon:yes stop_codon:yes gene_type:complete